MNHQLTTLNRYRLCLLFTVSYCFMACCVAAQAAGSNRDSLKDELKTATHDSTKIRILLELSEDSKDSLAQQYAQEAIELAGATGDRLSESLGLISLAYYDIIGFRFNEARDRLQQAETSAQGVDNPRLQYKLNHIFGLLERDKGNYAMAIKRGKRAVAASERLGYAAKFGARNTLSQSYVRMGAMMDNTSYLDTALSLLFEAKQWENVSFPNELETKAIFYGTLGQTYMEMSSPHYLDSSIFYLKKGLALFRQNGDRYREMSLAGLLATAYKQINRDSAMTYVNRSMALSKALDNKMSIAMLYHDAADLFAESGDYEQAYRYKDSLIGANHALSNETRRKQYAEMETKYETEKKEQQLLVQEAELQRKNTVIGAIVALAVLLVSLAGVWYNRYRLKKRSNAVLERKNERIETLMRELHHRVKNNLQVISSLLSLQSLRMEDGEARSAVEEGRHRVEAMGLIHQRLYQYDEMTGVGMKDYVEELVNNLVDAYANGPVNVKLDIEDLHLDIDRAVPVGLILNELCTNSFKHGLSEADKPCLEVGLRRSAEGITMLVADNGLGLPSRDGDGSNPSSFGLKLVEMLVKQLDATLDVVSHRGICYELRIPITVGSLILDTHATA